MDEPAQPTLVEIVPRGTVAARLRQARMAADHAIAHLDADLRWLRTTVDRVSAPPGRWRASHAVRTTGHAVS